MITIANIGNSFLKVARWDGQRMSNVMRVRHRDLLDSDWQAALSDGPDVAGDGVYVASVAESRVEQAFEAWLLAQGFDLPIYIKSARAAGGIQSAYKKPETLGVDRWCAMIAARNLHKGPLCVVDAGTAMTVDWVDKDGRHLGGMIMPGPHLQANSLFSNTRHVHESAAAPAQLFADNTSEAVAAGVCHACAALADRAFAEISARSEDPAKMFVTGGESARIVPLLSHKVEVEDNLVLQGVALLAEQHRG